MLVEKLDRAALILMVMGIILLFQPFSKILFTVGFPVLIGTYFLHSIFDHF